MISDERVALAEVYGQVTRAWERARVGQGLVQRLLLRDGRLVERERSRDGGAWGSPFVAATGTRRDEAVDLMDSQDSDWVPVGRPGLIVAGLMEPPPCQTFSRAKGAGHHE